MTQSRRLQGLREYAYALTEFNVRLGSKLPADRAWRSYIEALHEQAKLLKTTRKQDV